MKLFLVGYMGSGKSEVGKCLSTLLNMRYVDTDQWIESRCCKLISEIFYDHGESFFREKEKECLEFLMSQDDVVVSTGGGLPCVNDVMDLMNEIGETVYLSVNTETLCKRLWDEKEGRPLLNNCQSRDELVDFVKHHLEKRAQYYDKAKHIIEVGNASIEILSEKIKSILVK